MTLYIGENLKKQRKLRELTQEQLANILGVSFQSVSKWERSEGYPDIELLPTIADCFGITVDELIGMNEIRDSTDAKAILEKAKKNLSEGLIEENIRLLSEAVKVHPNNYELLAQYAGNLTFIALNKESEEYRENNLKAVEIAKRIVAECTDPKIRSRMQSDLCVYYRNLGMSDKALEAADALPSMWSGSELKKMDILKGGDLIRFTQNNVLYLTITMCNCIKLLSDVDGENAPELTWEQRIEILKKAVAIIEIVFDKGDHNELTWSMSCLNRDISVMALRAGDSALALDSIEKAAEYAEAADLLPDKKPYVSLLVNKLEYNAANMGKNFSSTFSETLLRKMSDSIYDIIRGDVRFKAVEERLKRVKESEYQTV
ncbi:MAG: helix-turn-helix domain-containing protein [Oscillospiraceae bacterium]|nr:helix-turn-helix domain-containing protein [Oscillospiraceae bacterium]